MVLLPQQFNGAGERGKKRKRCLSPVPLKAGLEAQRTQRGVAATKSEARNPKFETNQNDRNPNDLNKFKNETENLLNEISRKCTLVVQRIIRQD
jgi:hypothetical protein